MSAPLNPVELADKMTAMFPGIDIEMLLQSPLIIVSAPRSGSNLLFEQLAQVSGFWTIGGESHAIYRAFPHLTAENPRFDSGRLGERHADPETRRLFVSLILNLLRNNSGEMYLGLANGKRPSSVCLLEKTPRNALNIPFLRKLFPQAKFVYLYRDPRQAVASLIEAWTLGLQTGRFRTYAQLPDWDRSGWYFLLPPGWREYRYKSLAEITAFQWSASNRIIIDDLAAMPATAWMSITYEALVDDPRRVLSDICNFSGIDSVSVQAAKDDLPLSRTTLSPPHADKWKKHEREISLLLPGLLETLGRIEEFCGAHRGTAEPRV